MRINSYQLSRFDQVDQIDGQQTGCIAEMFFLNSPARSTTGVLLITNLCT